MKHAVIRKDLKIEVNEGTLKSDDSLMQKVTDEDKNRENYDNIENSNKCKRDDSCDNSYFAGKNNTYTISDQYVFRCGKVGPCGTIGEVLR